MDTLARRITVAWPTRLTKVKFNIVKGMGLVKAGAGQVNLKHGTGGLLGSDNEWMDGFVIPTPAIAFKYGVFGMDFDKLLWTLGVEMGR